MIDLSSKNMLQKRIVATERKSASKWEWSVMRLYKHLTGAPRVCLSNCIFDISCHSSTLLGIIRVNELSDRILKLFEA